VNASVLRRVQSIGIKDVRSGVVTGRASSDLLMVVRRRSSTEGRAAPGTPGRPGTPGADDPFTQEALSYVDSLYGTALRLTRRAPDAEDLVQDTYLKAFRSSSQFARGTNLKAWLFTILHNTFRNMRRHDGRNPVEVDSEAVESAQSIDASGAASQTPEQLLTRATLDADLQTALDALPDSFRQAVWLRDVEEFSYAEIAEMLDVPIGTVMSRLSRGRHLLFDRLSQSRATDAPSPVALAPRSTGGRRES
jgi:RNA polymerase sigma-70 factor, ECF subfamily